MENQKDNILYMAPVMGITKCIYRNVYAQHFSGYEWVIMPFIMSCNARKIDKKYLRDILPERNQNKHMLIPQILSKNADEFIDLAKAIHDLGYTHINWNLGCPHPMVRKKMRGSGLLPHPDVIRGFLDKVMNNSEYQLSLKVRLGSEQSSDLLALMPFLNEYPLGEIIIHPRTGKQMYGGSVDLNAFESCLEKSEHRIVYNGDINSKEDFKNLKQRFNTISRWMIGRGGIVNPFLPEEIMGKEIDSDEERIRRRKDFHQALFVEYEKELSGPRHLLDKMKGVWSYWHKAFDDGETIYIRICTTKKIDQYIKAVNTFFESMPEIVRK